MHYYLTGTAAYEHYIATYAPIMRQEGIDLWGDTVSYARRMLNLHRSYVRKD